MKLARGNRNHVAQTNRRLALTVKVAAPSHDRAIAAQRKRVKSARSDSDEVSCIRRNGASEAIAPLHSRAILFERATVVFTSGDRDDIAQSIGNGALIQTIVTPRNDRAVGFQSERMKPAGSDCDNIAEV